MTVYAFRQNQHSMTLTEFVSRKELTAEQNRLALMGPLVKTRIRPCGAPAARDWVKQGGHHETALYTDIDGKVRRASDGY